MSEMKIYWIIRGKKPIITIDRKLWNRARDHNGIVRVAHTCIGEVTISTVFLWRDVKCYGDRPLLFETVVFGGSLDGEFRHYPTWKEAEKGHKEICDLIEGKSDE